MKRVVFIDRDGVINVDPIGDYVKSWKEFRFEEGALEGLKAVTDLGYEIILISNQAGIGDGIYTESALHDIHSNMLKEFEKNGIRIRGAYFCIHGKQAGCKCRKPEIGLFERAAKEVQFDRASTFFIGDKLTDVQAGKRFGLKTIMVLTGHGKNDEPEAVGPNAPDFKARNLLEAVRHLKS
jgi:D-glycero-D-manno-heptose 1,7-bisphosphate phosphatase